MVPSSSWLIPSFQPQTCQFRHPLLLHHRRCASGYRWGLKTRFVQHPHLRFFSSLKHDEIPAGAHELFELSRKKRVRLIPPATKDRLQDRSTFPATATHPWEQRKEDIMERRLYTPSKTQLTNSKSSPGPDTTSIWKQAYFDMIATASRSVETSQIAPLLPFKVPVSVFFAFVFVFGITIGKWTERSSIHGVQFSNAVNFQGKKLNETKAPTGISVFLEGDLKKKESVEWVNMVLGKLWKIYRLGLENWIVTLLQPLIDNLKKPDYVKRVEIKRFDLGDEPVSIRSVERRTSRRADDLQYHIGLRYTGGAHMLLLLKLKVGLVPITIPVGVRGLDVDGELWVKLRLVPSEPWVGTVTWAFVTLPKIKLDLSPFRLFNLMSTPFVSVFLTKLLTEDLPQLFVRPNKNVIDFLHGRAVSHVSKGFKGATVENNTNFSGELSVTLVHARKLKYDPYGNTDPYVVLTLGDQVIRSKKNSQTTVIGPPGGPIWNQDFQLLVIDRRTQRLDVRVRDYFGITAVTVGAGEVDLMSLKDTIPVDKVVRLRGVWGPFRRRNVGEVLLRLTYTAYVEDDAEDTQEAASVPSYLGDDESRDNDSSSGSSDTDFMRTHQGSVSDGKRLDQDSSLSRSEGFNSNRDENSADS